MEVNKIKDPSFLKDLSISELETLSEDMRKFILESVSKTGGHLSSNLGIVDLTIALLKVFDAKKDVILFDVGHQCYPYKILTGRADKFNTLRQKDGLSGFQSIKESIYDKYEAGHSSTSISTGVGYALARDLDHKDYNVISVIGDGSISNGIAYEALNQLGDLQTKQIIILNDNQMSISKNVGAIHNALDSIRASKGYNDTKKNAKNILNKTKVGKLFTIFINKIKRNLKKFYTRKGSIFTDFNIEYYGPINGHDYKELLKYLEIAKNETKPVILHVITQKGKGYKLAEDDKTGKFHGVGKFDLKTGEALSKNNLPSFSEIISSYTYNFAKKDKDIICITPAMGYGSKLDIIKEKLPNQYIDVGMAEEHGLILANGLALAGKKPIVFIYSTFLQRGYDMLVHDIARMNTGVIFCIDRAGINGGDGISHQGVFDIPMMQHIPNIIISAPKDAKEANDLLYTALKINRPFAIRYPKANLKYDYNKAENLQIGSWEKISEGNDLTIITYGLFVDNAIKVANELKKENINAQVINARFIKPFDKDMFKKIVNENKPIIIYEDSLINGSLGSVLAQEIQKYDTKSKLYLYGVKDEFIKHASRDELIQIEGLDIDSIKKNIKKIIDK